MRLDAPAYNPYPASCFKPAVKREVLSPERVDQLSGAVGAQGVAQTGTRAAAMATNGSKAAKLADILEGDKLVISAAAERAAAGLTRAFGHVAPELTTGVQRLAPAALKGLGGAAHLAAKFGSVVGLPLCGFDVYKAVKEDDADEKRALTANASLSVAGAALGAAGAIAKNSRGSVTMLVGSAAIGAVQLADAYLLDGRLSARLGEVGQRTWTELKA